MRFLLVAFTGLMLLVTGSAAQANVSITVDKNAQLMTVAVDGVARYRWPVSTGIPSRETPNVAAAASLKVVRIAAFCCAESRRSAIR